MVEEETLEQVEMGMPHLQVPHKVLPEVMEIHLVVAEVAVELL